MLDPSDLELVMSRVKEVCVTRQECQSIEERQSEKMNAIMNDVTTCKTQLKAIIGILAAIAVPVLSIAINYLFKG